MQPRAPVSFLSFLGPEGRPQNGGFFHLIDKIAFLSLWECPKMGFFP